MGCFRLNEFDTMKHIKEAKSDSSPFNINDTSSHFLHELSGTLSRPVSGRFIFINNSIITTTKHFNTFNSINTRYVSRLHFIFQRGYKTHSSYLLSTHTRHFLIPSLPVHSRPIRNFLWHFEEKT